MSSGCTETQFDFTEQSPQPSQTRSLMNMRFAGSGKLPRLRRRAAWAVSRSEARPRAATSPPAGANPGDGDAELRRTVDEFAARRRRDRVFDRRLAGLLEAPVPRVYWYSVHDFEGLTVQEREQGWVSAHDYHMGLIERGYGSDGRLLLRPKGLYEVWARGGLDAVRELPGLPPSISISRRLIDAITSELARKQGET